MDLSAQIGNLKIDPAIMNAVGARFNSVDDVIEFLKYDVGAGAIKGAGIKPREGYKEPTIYSDDIFTLNRMGLPSPGYKSLRKELKEVYPLNKPLFCSIFGETKDELVEVANGVKDYCDGVEINFGCPNVEKEELKGMATGRDKNLVEEYTRAVKKVVKPKLVAAKLTPNVYDIGEIAIAAEKGGADAIAAINTVSPGMKINIYAKRPVLSGKFGGVSGPAIKPVGIASVYKIYEVVDIPIIGMGGIRLNNSEDFLEYVQAGASVCAIGTDFKKISTRTIKKQLKQFRKKVEKTVEELGASSLKELVGVAHES